MTWHLLNFIVFILLCLIEKYVENAHNSFLPSVLFHYLLEYLKLCCFKWLKKGRKTNSKPIPLTSTGILLEATLILMTISLNNLMLYFYRRSLSQGCFVFAWGLNYWKLHKFILYVSVSNIFILNFYIKINKSLWSRKKNIITARTSDLQNQDF